MSRSQAQILVVSGLSGSGKSTAMAALEDLGFYCVENLPAQLVRQFVDLCEQADPPIPKIALAFDAREEPFRSQVPALLQSLRGQGAPVEAIFLECSDEALVRRYNETRRVHPLSPGGSVQEGIQRERRLLARLAAMADISIDTTRLNVHELRSAVTKHVSGGERSTVVTLISFGFRYGTPRAVELLFDLRFLPNPYFDDALRARTGVDPDVEEYVLKGPRGEGLQARLRDLLGFLLPLYDQEGKSYLTIGFGCTGGRHRSVAVVESLARSLRAQGREVRVEHRDMERDE